MVFQLEKFRRNLLILLTLLSLFIILFLSFIDVIRMNKQFEESYIEKMNLAEMNVLTALKNLDKEYFLLDQQLAEKMQDYSEELLEKYNKNPNFEEWDFDKLKEQYGMDVYIINKNNQVIYSSYTKDIGLDFEECCTSFSKLLDERRKNGVFIHDGIDLQNDIGELKKYSYMPTKDGQYFIELSYILGDDPVFQQYDFVSVMNQLKQEYHFIESVSIFNGDCYKVKKSMVEALQSNNHKMGYLEWVNTTSIIKDSNYTFLEYPTNGESTKKLVEIVYDHTEFEETIRNNKLFFLIQIIGTFVLAILLVSFIVKIIEKPMYLAFHDRLTGLKNRAAFENKINQLLVKQKDFGILLLDFDNFKTVNDTLGHDSGDVFLKCVSEYIIGILPEYAFFARFGGDEFIVLLPDIHNKKELNQIANNLIQSFQITHFEENPNHSEIFADGLGIMKEANVTLSIGGAMYPEDGEDPDTLYKMADLALYSSKKNGKNRYTYYGDYVSDAE